MDIQREKETLALRIDDVQRQIDQAEQQGNEAKAISLRGEKIALINERTALINKQAGIIFHVNFHSYNSICLFTILFFQHQHTNR